MVSTIVPKLAAGPDPAADIAQLLDDLAPIFEGWRAQQAGSATDGPVKLVLNFTEAPPDDALVARALRAAFAVELSVGPLFQPDPEFEGYRLLTIPGVARIDRADLFDLARAVRQISAADTVEPDLGSDFYDFDRVLGEIVARPESSDLAFWCWADTERDKPKNADWAITTSGVTGAWAFSSAEQRPDRGAGIRVFQPDTGVAAHHRELPAGLAADPDATNFVEPGQPPVDPLRGGGNPGHGTGTSSVVVSDEDGAMRGVAPKATLVPIRCITSVAVFDQSPVAQAIDHARRKRADIITMSLGGVFSEALRAALHAAVQANVIVVAAAGNCVREVVWPARYADCIAVGGVNEADKPWRGSSQGPDIAISGPAELVLRADPRDAGNPDAVSPGQGTSFATAHLAGVAALWLAHHGRDALIARLPPGSTLQDMFRAAIRATARRPAHFDTGRYGAGIVNAEALMRFDPIAALAAVPSDAGTGVLGQLRALLDGVFGAGAAEAATPAFQDSQNYPELASAAFERLRAGRSQRARTEAMPPIGLSRGLRVTLGDGARILTHVKPADL